MWGTFYSSSSSSSSSSEGGTLSSTARNVPSSASFLNGPQRERIENAAKRYADVVCQIRTLDPTIRGTGCLIGGTLLLTNHHILRNVEIARQSTACFFQVTSQNIVGTETYVKIVTIALDPDKYFFTSPDRFVKVGKKREPQPASEGYLDFTVVALKADLYLSGVQNAVFSVFEPVLLKEGNPVCVIQYPEILDPDSLVRGDIRWSNGLIKQIKTHSLVYSALTEGGSSGGAVIDGEGNLVALHHLGGSDGDNIGVLMSQIAAALNGQKAAMEPHLYAPLPVILPQTRTVGSFASTEHFTGREKELQILREVCLDGARVAVVGMGGVGKTTLVAKYVADCQADYSLICCISAGTESQIEAGLLDLADAMNISKGPLEYRLLSLKRKLEGNQDRVLLIFDGVDDQHTLSYLKSNLPERGCVTLLLSSRLKDSTKIAKFHQVSLVSFTQDEAVSFLLAAVSGKDTDAEQAAILAEKLHCFPLALKHAAAFIAATPRCSFRRYLEGFEKQGFSLLGERYVHLDQEEKTILTTWKKSIAAILQVYPESFAEDILNFFSIFANAPIPVEIEEHLTFMNELDRQAALGHLQNYSLLEEENGNYVLHPLVQKVVRDELGDAVRGYLRQALHVFNELSKSLDLNDLRIYRHLDAYIPHFEFVIELLKLVCDIEYNNCIYSLFEVMWHYYFNNGKYESSRQIAEMRLAICQNQGLFPLEKAKNLFFMGRSLALLGQYKEALKNHQQALEIRREALGEKHPDTLESSLKVGYIFDSLGKISEASIHFEQVLMLSQELLGKGFNKAKNHRNIGLSLSYLGKYDEALPHHRNALKLTKDLGEQCIDISDGYESMAVNLRNLGRHGEALSNDKRALEIRKEVLGEKHANTASSYHNIGIDLRNLGRHEEALSNTERALAIRKEVLGEKHEDTAASYQNIGVYFADLGRYEEALGNTECALAIRKEVLGEKHEDTATSYQNIGVYLAGLGRYVEALSNTERALAIRKEVLGEKDSDTAKSYHSIGMDLWNLGRHEEALVNDQRALAIRKEVLGEKHVDTAASYQNIGLYLRNLGRYAEALSNTERALAIRKEVLGEKDADTARSYHSIGIDFWNLGRHEEALVNSQRALAIRKEVLGKKHMDTAASYQNIGVFLSTLGRHEEALSNDEDALEIRKEVLGEKHVDTANSYHNIGLDLGNLGRHEEALMYHQQGLEIRQNILGEKDADTATSYCNVGVTLSRLGEHEEALVCHQGALGIRRQVLEEVHPDTAYSHYCMGACLAKLGWYEEALSHYQKALKIRRITLGEIHIDTANSYHSVAVSLARLGSDEKSIEIFSTRSSNSKKGFRGEASRFDGERSPDWSSTCQARKL